MISVEKIRTDVLNKIVKNNNCINKINIDKAIEKREDLMKEDLGEMKKRIMNKRRETIRIDSVQRIIDNKVTITTDKKEILDKTRKHYEDWTRKRIVNEDEFTKNWKDIYEPIDTIVVSIYDNVMDDIKEEELDNVIKNLKNDKAPGKVE